MDIIDGIEITETCADCIHCLKLYVAPCYTEVPSDRYVCDIFAKEANRIDYISDNKGFCECFTRKEKKWKEQENS